MKIFLAGTPYASHERTLIDRGVRHRLLTYAEGRAVLDNQLRKWLRPTLDDARPPRRQR